MLHGPAAANCSSAGQARARRCSRRCATTRSAICDWDRTGTRAVHGGLSRARDAASRSAIARFSPRRCRTTSTASSGRSARAAGVVRCAKGFTLSRRQSRCGTRSDEARRWIVVGLVALLIVLRRRRRCRARRDRGRPRAGPRRRCRVRAPEGVRIRVQVLNGTKRPRTRATRDDAAPRPRLRRRGDGHHQRTARDTTLVLDLSGHPEWAKRSRAAVSRRRASRRAATAHATWMSPSCSASTWRPPAEPFHP